METLDTLNTKLLTYKAAYNNVIESLIMYANSASDILKTESLNKIRRYGHYEDFSYNKLINLNSHLRIYLHHKSMEEQLIKQKIILQGEMQKILMQMIELKSKKNGDNEKL